MPEHCEKKPKPKFAAVEPVLGRQLGLVSREQLIDAGFTKRRVETLVASDRLRLVRPCVFAVVGAPRSWAQELMAVVLSAGGGAVASHSAAAALWQFSPRPEDHLEITVERNQCPRIEGVRVHRSMVLDDADVLRSNGIPRTTFERTLCDCTGLLSEFQLGRALDDGLRRGVATIKRVEGCMQRLESARGRKMSKIRALLAVRTEGYEPGGSASELRVLEVVVAAGLPAPVQQLRVQVGGRRYELDYAWPAHKVFAEYYGLNVHSGPSAVAYDSERLTLLVSAGWKPLVFTDASGDGAIAAAVAAALAEPVDARSHQIGA